MATPNTERKLRPGTYYCENRGILKPVEKEAAQARGMNKTNSPLSDAVVLMLLSLQEKKERPPPPTGNTSGVLGFLPQGGFDAVSHRSLPLKMV